MSRSLLLLALGTSLVVACATSEDVGDVGGFGGSSGNGGTAGAFGGSAGITSGGSAGMGTGGFGGSAGMMGTGGTSTGGVGGGTGGTSSGGSAGMGSGGTTGGTGGVGGGTGGSGGGTGGTGGSSCMAPNKLCGGLCVVPNPQIGCDLTSCTPCPDVPNATESCLGTSCDFVCDPGYTKNGAGTACVTGTGTGGAGGSSGSGGSGGGPTCTFPCVTGQPLDPLCLFGCAVSSKIGVCLNSCCVCI